MAEELNKQMPASVIAEQSLLGCILFDPQMLSEVAGLITEDDFYLADHAQIYAAMKQLFNENHQIDSVTLIDTLVKSGTFDKERGQDYILTLSDIVPNAMNITDYARIIKEKSLTRQLIEAAAAISADAYAGQLPVDELMDSAQKRIFDISQGRDIRGFRHIKEVMGKVFDELSLLAKDKNALQGVMTGFSGIDRVLSGMGKSDLVLIGARPGMGKTSFALNIARNMAVTGRKKVVFFSLEMSKEQLAQRILATEARVESSKFRTGEISPEEWNRIGEAAYALNDAELYFDDTSTITVNEMKSRVRRMKNVDCVIIDYLQLMTGTKKTDSRVQEVSEITRNLKLMAKDLHIPVVTCSQLNRSTDARGKAHRPQMSDLRESGSIEQDADIILMLYREGYYESDGKDDSKAAEQNAALDNKAQVLVVKNRHGSTGDVDLNWTKEFTLFSSLETVRNE